MTYNYFTMSETTKKFEVVTTTALNDHKEANKLVRKNIERPVLGTIALDLENKECQVCLFGKIPVAPQPKPPGKNTVEQRLTNLETGFGNLSNQVGVLTTDVETLKSDVVILKKDVEILKNDVAILKTDVETLKKDVEILKADVETLKSDVAWLKQQVASLTADIQELKQLVLLLIAQQKQFYQEFQDFKKEVFARFAVLESLPTIKRELAKLKATNGNNDPNETPNI